MKRFFFCLLAAVVFFAELSALEWPADTQNFLRLFGQRIGENTFEQGLTFEEAMTVRAADDGILLITLDKKYGTGAFPSTLGNALVFLHDDGLQTVYGNLDDTMVFRNRVTTETADGGTLTTLSFRSAIIKKKYLSIRCYYFRQSAIK